MSSMIRRIARTIAKRKNSHKIGVHFAGRGSKLGVTNPKGRELLARKARDAKWGRA